LSNALASVEPRWNPVKPQFIDKNLPASWQGVM
jgi:hypothetical protein